MSLWGCMLTVIFMIEIIMEIYFYDRLEAVQTTFFLHFFLQLKGFDSKL